MDIHLKLALPNVSNAAATPTNHLALFLAAYDRIQRDLLSDAAKHLHVDPHRLQYLLAMMNATTLGGKYNRGLTVVELVDAMTKSCSSEAKDVAVLQGAVGGWMIEMMQAHFLVEDDIMDASFTRRGKPCWYRYPGVKVPLAINDGLILFAWCTQMALRYFKDHRGLVKILELFHRTHYQTTIGQLYDVTSMYDSSKLNPEVEQPATTDFIEFTLDHYKQIVRYKTSYYTYYLPLALGLAVVNNNNVPDALVDAVAMLMGEYFQVQDDVFDCFADPAVLGKIGTDIQDCKCSWLATTFLTCASGSQKETFKQHYGKHEEEHVTAIKALYCAVNLQQKFEEYESGVVLKVQEALKAIEGYDSNFGLVVEKLWFRTYKRQK